MKNTQNARIKKTRYYIENRIDFMIQLMHEIDLFIKRSKKNNVIPTIRLNGTSDIAFENFKYHNGLNIMENFPQVQFYDYTVTFKRMKNRFLNFFACFKTQNIDLLIIFTLKTCKMHFYYLKQ